MPSAGSFAFFLLRHAHRTHPVSNLAACQVPRLTSTRPCERCPVRQYSQQAPQSPLQNFSERSESQSTFIFESTSNNPYHNLAIEHFLLTTSDVNSRILFFYTNRPCVVIGRNQNPWVECDLRLIQNDVNGSQVDLVRRRSGGGTVFHDEGNLNFSVIVPNDKDFTRRKHSEMVVKALNSMHKVTAEYDGPETIWVNDRHDITMAGMQNKGRSEFKVSGSAYKLTRGRALHHGTLLHSSPNLENISRLLRSPGKDYLEARGVASVRSPVSNLFNVQTGSERNEIRREITKSIINEFSNLYQTQNTTTETVGDHDCSNEVNPAIARGVDELMTDEWRFGQTPRFDFSSKLIHGKQLSFAVKNGMIEEARLGLKEIPKEERPLIETQKNQLVHTIDDWSRVFKQSNTVSTEQLSFIREVFPDIQKLLRANTSDVSRAGRILEHDERQFIREFRDGSAEKEKIGLNVIEEVKR